MIRYLPYEKKNRQDIGSKAKIARIRVETKDKYLKCP